MKKIYIFILLIFTTLFTFSQAWEVYDADVLPDEAGFVPSNTGGSTPGNTSNTIIADPDDPDNNLLEMKVDSLDARYMWRYDIDSETDSFTVVFRMKGFSGDYDRAMEMDIQLAGHRERLYLKTDNTYELNEIDVSDDLPGGVLDWHIYRITKDSANVSVYIDEKPVPVVSGITSTTSGSNYFRFGDGNGSSTLAAYVDWVIWDTTGIYAPGEGVSIPDSLVQTVPGWIVYDCDVLPSGWDPAFGTSNVSGSAPTNNIIADPENPGNSLLEMIVDTSGSKFQWRHYYEGNPKRVTWVARFKGISDTLDRTMEIELYNGGYRERLFVQTYRQSWRLREADVEGDLEISTMGWHIFRLQKDSSVTSFYIDEDPVPIATVVTPTTNTGSYFRFGDNDSNREMGALIDWMIWDTTGAYAPDGGTFIPDSLITDIESADADLSDISSNVGILVPAFNPDSLDYTLNIPFGTDSVKLSLTASDAVNALISGDTLFTVFPDTAIITVTAEDSFRKEYTIIIQESGTDASLSDLASTVGTLVPAFAPEVTSYELRVPAATTSLTLTATTNDPNASAAGDGEITTIPGMVTITVTALQGNTQDYTVDITLMSSDATLSELSSNVGTLDPPFDAGTTNYTLGVPAGTASIFILANPTDANAQIAGDGTFTNIPGTATISVTAEDGTSQDYTIDVNIVSSVTNYYSGLYEIYPNPVNNELTVKLNSENCRLTIYDMLGQMLYQRITSTEKLVYIDFSEFRGGMYILKVSNGEDSVIDRIVKE